MMIEINQDKKLISIKVHVMLKKLVQYDNCVIIIA